MRDGGGNHRAGPGHADRMASLPHAQAHAPGGPSTRKFFTGHYDAHGNPIYVTAQRNAGGGYDPVHSSVHQANTEIAARGGTPPTHTGYYEGGQYYGPDRQQNDPHGVQGSHPPPLHDPTVADSSHRTAAPSQPNFTARLQQMLGQSATAQMVPTSLADQVAAPDRAAAQAAQTELDQLPSAKRQALANVMGWYGQVRHSEQKAAGRDQHMANAGAASMAGATKGIMASLGGSANGGAGEIGAVGANNANTLRAMGANDASLASDLGPIFKLARADAGNKTQQQFGEGKIALENALAAAHGQGAADRANALIAILGQNNSARQTDFSNRAGLLNSIASMEVSGANAASQAQSRRIEDALRLSEIQKNTGRGGGSPMTGMQHADFVNKIVGSLVDPNSGKLKSGIDWPTALRDARNFARTAGLNPYDRSVINTVIGPALSQAGITGNGPNGYWPAIYQP